MLNAVEKVSRNIDDVKLVCVSKTYPIENIRSAMECGECCFGENRPQELRDKINELPDKKIEWHFIGNLQKNKVKYVVGKSFLIHSVNSLEIAMEINKRAEKLQIIQNILLEVNVSGELTKSGFEENQIYDVFHKIKELKNINLKGLMTMAPFTDDVQVVRNCFGKLRGVRDKINELDPNVRELSMGMSNDYEIAIEEGATLIRVGTDIFGIR